LAFIDLPTGAQTVSPPPNPQPSWPNPIESTQVPARLLSPTGVEIVPLSEDWQSIPVIRADCLTALAIRRTSQIDVFSVASDGSVGESPIWNLPPDVLTTAAAEEWTRAFGDWRLGNGMGEEARLLAVKAGVARVEIGGRTAPPRPAWLWAGDGPLREGAAIEFV
jgi:hypothetical protein